MNIFVTGATGFVGSALVQELLQHGHTVTGLARSQTSADALQKVGAQALAGDIVDCEVLRRGASKDDGVIHLAFNYDYSQNEKSVADERNAVAAMAETMSGSGRPLVITSATAMAASVDGGPSTEESPVASFNPRGGIETLAKDLVDDGANIAIVRVSQIHDTRKQGFTSYLLAHAREKGVAAYVGDGESRWAAAHVSDTARLYRLAFERGQPGAVYHAVAEEGVKLRAIAEAHANGLGVPLRSIAREEAEVHFGWIAPFATLDLRSSSALTQQRLDWRPTGPGLLADLVRMDYGSV